MGRKPVIKHSRKILTSVEIQSDIKHALDVYLAENRISMGRIVNGILAAVLSGELVVRNTKETEFFKNRPNVNDLYIEILDSSGNLLYRINSVE